MLQRLLSGIPRTEHSMLVGPSAYYRYSDNKLGDTRALIGESVCQTCQTEGDMQCHSNDRWHPAYITREKCQADSYCIQLEGRQRTLAAICEKCSEIMCNGLFGVKQPAERIMIGIQWRNTAGSTYRMTLSRFHNGYICQLIYRFM